MAFSISLIGTHPTGLSPFFIFSGVARVVAGESVWKGEDGGEQRRPPLQTFSIPPPYLSVLLRTIAFEFKSQKSVVFLLWLHHDNSPLRQMAASYFSTGIWGKVTIWKGEGDNSPLTLHTITSSSQLLLRRSSSLKLHPFYYWLSTMDAPLLSKGLRATPAAHSHSVQAGSQGRGLPGPRSPSILRQGVLGWADVGPCPLLSLPSLLFPFFFLFYAPSLLPSLLSFWNIIYK